MGDRLPLLVSIAILKVNFDQGRDYIDNFIPFVAECIRLSPSPVVSLEYVQECIAKSFGFSIPQFILKTILKRAKRRGFIEKKDKVYYRVDSAFSGWDFPEKRRVLLHEYEILVGELVRFTRSNYGIDLSPNRAVEILNRYIRRHSLEILSGATTLLDREDSRENFILGEFIFYIQEEKPEHFRFLENMVKGRMLADTLFFGDFSTIEQRLSSVEIYLDTTFLLRACGYSFEYYVKPCVELLHLLRELGARLACFEHTYQEMEEILKGDAERLRNYFQPAYGETYRYFCEVGKTPSDVELLAARLPHTLEKLHVKIKKRPPHEISLGVDEEKLRRLLQERVGYRNRRALLRDIDSLTAIYRLRRGRTTLPLERCGAIFVTTNTALARASLEFFSEQVGPHKIPICLPARIIATLAWLKKPQKAPDLPHNVIIADCYAALSPSDALWLKYIEEVENLRVRDDISEEDYYVLRFSSHARDALMDVTLGEPEVITEGTVREVLRRAHEAIRAEEERKRREAERIANEARQETARLQSEKVKEAKLRDARYETVGRKIAELISWACVLPLFALLGYAAFATQPPKSLPLFIVSIIASIVLFINSTIPIVPSLRIKIKEKIAPTIVSKLKALFEPNSQAKT